MLNEIGTVDNIPEFIEGVKNRSVLVSDLYHYMLTRKYVMIMMMAVFDFMSTGNEKCRVLGIVCTRTMIPEQRLSKS